MLRSNSELSSNFLLNLSVDNISNKEIMLPDSDYVNQPAPILEVRDLCKTFKTGTCNTKKVKAVNNVSFTVHEGELFCLLSYNKLGKQTTLNMLAGLSAPDSGRCRIYGYDIFYDMNTIRNILGMCPTYNIYWNSLTAEEHLYIFAKIKGIPNIEKEIKERLREVNLDRKAHSFLSSFNECMRIRLSIAISTLGGVKILIMEDPTIGMDPNNSHEIWDVIKRVKNDKVIIISTDSIREATVLSDVIGIMEEGTLKCFGTQTAFQKKYGKAYNLSFIIKGRKEEYINYWTSINDVSLLISQYDEENKLLFKIPTEIIESLPDLLQQMSEELKSHLEKWELKLISMEDVYFKLINNNITIDDVSYQSLDDM